MTVPARPPYTLFRGGESRCLRHSSPPNQHLTFIEEQLSLGFQATTHQSRAFTFLHRFSRYIAKIVVQKISKNNHTKFSLETYGGRSERSFSIEWHFRVANVKRGVRATKQTYLSRYISLKRYLSKIFACDSQSRRYSVLWRWPDLGINHARWFALFELAYWTSKRRLANPEPFTFLHRFSTSQSHKFSEVQKNSTSIPTYQSCRRKILRRIAANPSGRLSRKTRSCRQKKMFCGCFNI
jgi:hypothetical protein